MKTLLHKTCLVISIIWFANKAMAQEYYDATNTPRQYYYNNFESATTSTPSTFLPQAGSARSTNATIDLVSGSSLNSSKSLSSLGLSAIGYLQWDFMKSSLTTGAGLNLANNTYEWEFDYKNVSGAATKDPDPMVASTGSSTDSWRYWLIANTYTVNSGNDYTKGLYVTQTGGNLVLRSKFGSASNQSKTYVSVSMPNSSTATYQIRIVKSVIGYYYIYILNRTTGVTTTSGPTNVGTNESGVDLNTYNYSYLESSTFAAGRFQWDNFNFYQQKVDYVPITSAANGITTGPIYAGQTGIIPYGINMNIRGDVNIGRLRFNSSANAQALFSTGTLYYTSNSFLSVATAIGSVTTTAFNTTNTQQMDVNQYYYSPGNTDGTTANVINYFIVANTQNPFFTGFPSAISFSVSSAAADDFQSFYTSGYYPFSGAASTTGATITAGAIYDWVGSNIGGVWSTPGNWGTNIVPGPNDIARIGVNNNFTYAPIVTSTTTVGNILIGNVIAIAYPSITVNSGVILNVNGNITKQSDNYSYFNGSLTGYTTTLTGSGTINAANIAIISNKDLTPFSYTETITSTISNLNLTNLLLTSTYGTFVVPFPFNASFILKGGLTKITGTVQTSNTTYGTSSLIISPTTVATLQLTNATALSGLSATGTNVVTFNNTGATVEYSGTTSQTVYTDANITGLAGGVNYQNIKFSSNGIKTPNTGNLNVAGDYTNTLANDATNYVNYSLTTPVIFNGTTAQTLQGGAGTGTTFYNVTFSGASTKTMSTGLFNVASSGLLTMSGTNASTILNAGGLLTLISDATGSASIDKINGPSIIGNVNAQRYVTGTVLARRGYRLLSAPVNQGVMTGTTLNGYGFTDLQLTTPITGYTASGAAYSSTVVTPGAFDKSLLGNPTVFFYNEADIDPINQQFVNSDYKGIASIGQKLPVGNGFLFFFRGNRSVTGFNGANKTSTTSVPENTTLNWTGVPNQGPITVSIPVTSSVASDGSGHKVYTTPTSAAGFSTSLGFTNVASSLNNGLHLVGNPYASAIDLDAITVTNPSTNKFIYMLNNANTFGVYTRGSGSATLNNGVGRYVASGQGFFIFGISTGNTTVGFTEAAKVNTIPAATTPTTFMTTNKPTVLAMTKKDALDLAISPSSIMNASPVQTAAPAVVNITLLRDSDNMNETVIQFGDKSTPGSNKYNQAEDAIYRSGISQTTFMASYTSDNKPCIINTMGALDTVKSVPLYVEGNVDGLYTLNFKGAKTIDSRYILYLVDHFMKDSLDLSANDTYNFNLQRGNAQTFGATRFELVKHKSGLQYNLLGFNGAKKTGSVVLNWKTEHEGTYTMFALQRSTDGGKTFTTIDSLASDGSGSYTMTDVKPANGTNQYRLVQTVGLDPSALSKIVIIGYQPPGNDNLIANFDLYPNPSVDIIKLRLNNVTQGKLSIKIYNVDGRVVSNSKANAGGTISQDVSNLLRGGYVLEVSNADGSYYATKKFSKL